MAKSRSANAMAYLPFAYYYIGPVALLTYVLSGRSLLGRFSKAGIIYFFVLSLYLLLLFSQNGIANGLYVARFYWGFLLFYLAFRSGIRIHTDNILIVLSALTIVEAVLVNTIVPVELWPNYPQESASSHFAPPGEYQRPYSFGGNASVASVSLVALLAISKLGLWGKSLAVAAVVSCMSGSGFLALFIYLFATLNRVAKLLAALGAVWIIYSGLIYKISSEYLSLLFDVKSMQIMEWLPVNFMLLGIPYEQSMGGDFAGLSFIALNGLAGLVFLFSIIFLNVNERNWLPILIMLVGTLHYGVMFYLPGQLIFGYLLNLKSGVIVYPESVFPSTYTSPAGLNA